MNGEKITPRQEYRGGTETGNGEGGDGAHSRFGLREVPTDVTMKLWLRESSATSVQIAQERFRERVTGLEDDERVDETVVRTWSNPVVQAVEGSLGPSVGEAARRVAEMEQWAMERGRSLTPAFQRRIQTSSQSGELQERIVLPIVCLTLTSGSSLRGVFPHSDGDHVYTVEEFLDWWEDTGDDTPIQVSNGVDIR